MESAYILVLCLLATLASQGHAQATVIPKPITQDKCYCLREVVDKLRNPLSAIFYKEGKLERLLVVEQRGVVLRFQIDGKFIDTFMDISDRVVTSEAYGEARGLLSVVLDPFFHVSGKVYAYYIRNDTGKDYAYVSRFTVANGKVNKDSELFLLRIYQPFATGNGGPMLFGDDGYLYIFTGDGGEEDDPKGNAQNKNSFHGKVLRIDVDGGQDFTEGESGIAKTYSVPKSNPFYNTTMTKNEIYALGIRNMWGCSQDSVRREGGTGNIFCAETGTDKYDEINIIEKGRNYGWNIKEGLACINASKCNSIADEGIPIYSFKHNTTHSLVGGYIYRGESFTWMSKAGYYTFGDVMTSKTYLLDEASPGIWKSYDWPICESSKCPSNARESPLTHILAFAQDLEDELYVLMTADLVLTTETGKLLKIVPPSHSSRMMPQVSVIALCSAVVIIFKQLWALCLR